MGDYVSDIGKKGGVWVGQYRRMRPDGEFIQQWKSRQETRAVGDVWYERVTYSYEDGTSKTMDFKARLAPTGEHFYENDTRLRGRSHLTGVGQVVFPYVWHDLPDVSVVEMQHYVTEFVRTRIWQRFEKDVLTEIMVIREEKRPDESPAVWE